MSEENSVGRTFPFWKGPSSFVSLMGTDPHKGYLTMRIWNMENKDRVLENERETIRSNKIRISPASHKQS